MSRVFSSLSFLSSPSSTVFLTLQNITGYGRYELKSLEYNMETYNLQLSR